MLKKTQINGLMQDLNISMANTLEIIACQLNNLD